MKIRKVKWKSHPVLGDLELSFINRSNNKAYNTVLLAGENGTGKSTILEEISSFLNFGAYDYFDFVEYEIGDAVYKTFREENQPYHRTFFDILDNQGGVINIRHDRNNNPDLVNTETRDIRYYGCIYSKARSDYKTQKITSTTTIELDKTKHDVDLTEDFTSLKQLIVDVVNQDNAKYSEINRTRGSNPQSWDDFYVTSKLFRFNSAFDSFFDKMSYEKVDDIEGEKSILFKKNSKLIPIDKLSTGEKQIVFRGIFLLRNTSILDGAAVMIDEPELSMHPKWERKILSYYKRLFSMSGQQKAQILFATHSDHVLKEALRDNTENIVITLEEKMGIIICRNIDAPKVLPSITTAETTYLAFDVVSNDYHIELYGWLQDKENKRSVNACDNFIKSHQCYDLLKHAKPSAHGTVTYETLSTYIRNAIHHPDSGNTFTEDELRVSIELLADICR
ncbi:ATP-binding protein [Pantoea agglomerans]|uniref:AAA family ATPase n=1 Tax=Enterobacter agglomerans TaxID=549 RepID=UPI0031200F30